MELVHRIPMKRLPNQFDVSYRGFSSISAGSVSRDSANTARWTAAQTLCPIGAIQCGIDLVGFTVRNWCSFTDIVHELEFVAHFS